MREMDYLTRICSSAHQRERNTCWRHHEHCQYCAVLSFIAPSMILGCVKRAWFGKLTIFIYLLHNICGVW
uniref:Uncharacterized protein n=1 Tax=Physcomitrium patens TaxID=3218 RepID=A0A2K1JQG3_PHYPA|nr:hypothetical protein PHYPA_016163 [Physcomitrium patens]